MNTSRLLTLVLSLVLASRLAHAEQHVGFAESDEQIAITVDGRPFASYVYRDDKILRPYLAHVFAPGGVQVTRNHPPIAGVDRTDHDAMHPGIWLAFGDLGGADFWRNKGRVELVEIVERPHAIAGGGRFAVELRYRAADRTICNESCRLTIMPGDFGAIVVWDSTFTGAQPFAFGDQEEMGLGLRVATPLAVVNGGQITNAEGLRDEKQVWGKTSNWCDYSGVVDARRVGVMLVPDPANFRPSWFHARDYGFVAANPFGRQAFTKSEKSRIEVRPGERFRLRFAVVIHGAADDLAALYRAALVALEASR